MTNKKKVLISYLCINTIFLLPVISMHKGINPIFTPLYAFYFPYFLSFISLLHVAVFFSLFVVMTALTLKNKGKLNKLFYGIYLPLFSINAFLNVYYYPLVFNHAMSNK